MVWWYHIGFSAGLITMAVAASAEPHHRLPIIIGMSGLCGVLSAIVNGRRR